jgi:hypothetical protein
MKVIKLGRGAMLAAGIAGLALIAGCHSSAPEPAGENNITNFVETSNAMEENAVVETPAPVANVVVTPSKPGQDFTTDAQTYDDADATGDTARIKRDNESEPAQ